MAIRITRVQWEKRLTRQLLLFIAGTSSGGSEASAFVARQSSAKPPLRNHEGNVQYVNFLVLYGYSVQIVGGKHFNTPEGEFVELKSGTQYKIRLKNSHPYGKVALLWLRMHCRNAKVRNDKLKETTIAIVILLVIDRVPVVMIDVMKKMVDPEVLSRRSEVENETAHVL